MAEKKSRRVLICTPKVSDFWGAYQIWRLFSYIHYNAEKIGIKIPTLADTIVSNKGRYYGTGDKT